VFDAATGEELVTVGKATHPTLIEDPEMWALAWSPDGTRLATADAAGTAEVWDASTGAQLFVLEGHAGDVTDVSWSPDGTRLATAGTDGTVKVWQVG
jgi:WD40 repeat protein